MTPVLKFIRNTIQKYFGTFYEGPEPPARLSKLVVAFMQEHPKATKYQWAQFASSFARECYQSGFQRGYEWTERGLDRPTSVDVDEAIAHLEEHGWDWDGAPDLNTYALTHDLDEQVGGNDERMA